MWGLDGSPEQKEQQTVEFLTKQMIGKTASHGGDDVKDQPRKFGLLYLENSGAAKELADKFAADMKAAGSPFAEVVAYQLDPATIQADGVAGDHQDEGGRRHDDRVQRRSGGAP